MTSKDPSMGFLDAKNHSGMFIITAFALIAALANTGTIATGGGAKFALAQQAPPKGEPQTEADHTVSIANGTAQRGVKSTFNPATITVRDGSLLTFLNLDVVEHSAVAGTAKNGPTGQFDTDVIEPGKNVTISINDKPGATIQYFCKIHPFLTGTIKIAANEEAGGGATETQPQQQQQQQRQTTNNNNNSVTTFTASGPIASWASGPSATADSNVTLLPYVISGAWNLKVVNGTAKSFDANITMVKADGTDFHTHRLLNFRAASASLANTLLFNQTENNNNTSSNNRTEIAAAPLTVAGAQSELSIPGHIDITTDGNETWPDVSVNVMIRQWHTINIVMDENATNKHFTEGHYAPAIYGGVSSVKDKDGKELLVQQ
jgi:plastocyanin